LLQCDDIDIHVTIPGNNTLLHLLAKSNLKAALETLIEKLNSVHCDFSYYLLYKNDNGLTPLEVAAKEKNEECVRILMAASTDESVSDSEVTEYIKGYHLNFKKSSEVHLESKPTSESEPLLNLPKPCNELEVKAQQSALAMLSSNPIVVSKMDAKAAVVLKDKGNQHFAKKEWESAYNFYTQAIKLNPQEAAFYSNRSSCLVNLSRPQEALEDAVVARNLRPDWSKACYRLAVARMALGYYQEAAMACWEGLQLDPKSKELKSLLQKCVVQGRESFRKEKQGNLLSS
jgi:tetratricopeptide (TPR) repeat protein